MPKYKYGEEVEYEFTLLNFSDKEKLQKFNCGNKKLNSFIHDEIIPNNEVINEDGLMFKAEDKKTGNIIAIVSLAASGIIFTQTNYSKVLPAIKVDVFAVDKEYQKLHYNQETEEDKNPDNHYYLSDCIMGEVIQHCKLISEEYALVNYILLYADKKAYRFYKRNFFLEFELYMEQENSMEIKENIPMYMKL